MLKFTVMFWEKTFTGGIHPDYSKELSSGKPIENAPLPRSVTIPLIMHTGAICDPLVKPGDLVKAGQKIGESSKYISAAVHASISGTVKAIEPRLCFTGALALSVVIESDGKNEAIMPAIEPDVLKAIKEAGIVGMGGAAFPTHVKLSPPKDKPIEYLLINGAECEPFLTCDHRIMLEETELVLEGISLAAKLLKVEKVFIGIEGNKQDVIDNFKLQTSNFKTDHKLQIVKLETKYPQGGEKQLIKAITGREVPSGGLPYEVGVVVLNVGTCAQIAKTLHTGMPLIERVVTVTGKYLKEPKNLRVKIGTSFKELIEFCGGVTQGEIKKVISGGPMMGIAVPSLDVPVVKGTSGILVMIEEEARLPEPEYCLRCGKCVDICPQYLLPNYLADYSEKEKFEKCEKFGALDCIECGACSYVCASKRNLAQLIKLAKAEIIKQRITK